MSVPAAWLGHVHPMIALVDRHFDASPASLVKITDILRQSASQRSTFLLQFNQPFKYPYIRLPAAKAPYSVQCNLTSEDFSALRRELIVGLGDIKMPRGPKWRSHGPLVARFYVLKLDPVKSNPRRRIRVVSGLQEDEALFILGDLKCRDMAKELDPLVAEGILLSIFGNQVKGKHIKVPHQIFPYHSQTRIYLCQKVNYLSSKKDDVKVKPKARRISKDSLRVNGKGEAA